MSREELADAVVQWLARNGHDVAFDANHLGKIERGIIKRPRPIYVAALCAALGATKDELGFGQSVVNPDNCERISQATANPRRTDSPVIDAVAGVLVSLRRLEDETSAADVFPAVVQQRDLIERLAREARSKQRPTAVGLASEHNQYLGWLSFTSDNPEEAKATLTVQSSPHWK